jgi:uncharacterized membrane protein (UPF0127 family)
MAPETAMQPSNPEAAAVRGTVTIDDGLRVRVEVARTPTARARGLSGHAPLGEDEGMLFLFETADRYGFWMKDMLFPIDILWIRDGVIVDVTSEASVPGPDGALSSYAPREPADTVLEVRAGFAADHGIVPGLSVRMEVDR